MAKQTVQTSRIIDAPHAALYAIIADYRGGHAAILPKPYFDTLNIESGGTGAGTVYRLKMVVMGQTFHFHQQVTEPDPGRVIAETDVDSGLQTRFIFDPLDEQHTRVTFETDWQPSPGVRGWIERLFTPMTLILIYNKELDNLADYAASNPASAG